MVFQKKTFVPKLDRAAMELPIVLFFKGFWKLEFKKLNFRNRTYRYLALLSLVKERKIYKGVTRVIARMLSSRGILEA
jgi:hypothetical protein